MFYWITYRTTMHQSLFCLTNLISWSSKHGSHPAKEGSKESLRGIGGGKGGLKRRRINQVPNNIYRPPFILKIDLTIPLDNEAPNGHI